MDIHIFLTRIGVSILCGGLIGFERQYRHKDAGLRTNALVSLGAALYVLLSIELSDKSEVDVTRIIAQVVTGIGFLGGGVIFKSGDTVKGLTSGATIWCSAGLGCVAASGFLLEALLATLLILTINIGLSPLEKWLGKKKS